MDPTEKRYGNKRRMKSSTENIASRSCLNNEMIGIAGVDVQLGSAGQCKFKGV